MNLGESPFPGQTVRPGTGALGRVSSFHATCQAWPGLLVGSTGVRRFRVQVSGNDQSTHGVSPSSGMS
jgi:hypothetical protein